MHTIQELQADLKAEVVAAAYLAQYPDVSKIIIDRLGNLSRSHTKDIYKIERDSSQPDRNALLTLQSFRQSIYDAMPENVFHPPTLGGVGRTEEQILDEIHLQRKREIEARTFFKPFEQEASYVEIQTLLLELMYEKKGQYDDLLQLFDRAWPVLRKLPAATAISFVYILPHLNRLTGNMRWTEQCLTFLTGFPVAITEHYEWKKVDTRLASFAAGANNRLGIDSNFSGQQYDGIAGWDIHIGPVQHEMVDVILSQTDFRELLDILSDYLLPAAVSVRFFIKAEPYADTVLSPDRNTARLGYTFFL